MKHSNGTFTHLEEQLCQYSLNSNYTYRSYGPDQFELTDVWTDSGIHECKYIHPSAVVMTVSLTKGQLINNMSGKLSQDTPVLPQVVIIHKIS